MVHSKPAERSDEIRSSCPECAPERDGGVPDAGRMAQLCRERPAAPECAFIAQRHGDQLTATDESPVWAHDPRIKAAVIAAPAASYLFGPGSLKQVSIPVQLWRASDDTQAPDAWNSAVVLRELPVRAEVHTVANAGHYAFLAPCSEALKQAVPFICTDGPVFDRASFHSQFNHDVVAFFSRSLGG
jgi:predicted dienelactone hydrolase